MEVDQILNFLVGKWPVVGIALQVLGGLVVAGYAYVKISNGKDDDAFLLKLEGMPVVGSLLKALIAFSPVQRKV
jgi:hypothetical protein